MKKSILILVLFLPIISQAQAHLGVSLIEIEEMHPDNIFKIDYATNGTKYIYTDMPLGTFYYYFEKETGLSYYCMQIPTNLTALNTQVEIYNSKYVIVSETSWKAYLEGGAIMKINLEYNDEYGLYSFGYTF